MSKRWYARAAQGVGALSSPARRLGWALVVALAAGACSADLTSLGFALPRKEYRLDPGGALWVSSPAEIPQRACAQDDDCCDALGDVVSACGRVRLRCEQPAGVCRVALRIEQVAPVNLLRDIPDLSLLDEGTRQHLRVEDVAVMWQDAAPRARATRISLYLAPWAAPSSGGPSARRIAFTAEGRVTAADAPVGAQIDGEGAAAALRDVLAAPQIYYALIAAVDWDLPAGSVVPRGAFTLAADVRLSTRLLP